LRPYRVAVQQINGREATIAALSDSRFVVPSVPPAASGIAWLRATVGRFSSGPAHDRRRALAVAVLDAVPPATLRTGGGEHPVTVLARALGIAEPVTDLVRDVAQAYQPGTGDESRADAAVDRLMAILGGERDESAAALIGVLTQAYDATATLIERARHRPVDEVLHDDPPVRATRRRALMATTVGGVTVECGEVVLVGLAGGPAFGAGPHRCPGREHALALVAGALAGDSPTVHQGSADTGAATGTD
jgi:hypothetical protein